MKIGVCGSRSITDREWLDLHMRQNVLPHNDRDHLVILSGGAKGVDTLAAEFAKDWTIPHILFKPYHMVDTSTPYKKKFFFVRNKQIIDNADEVLILWDGVSGGTGWCIKYCEQVGKPHKVVMYDPNWKA